MGLSLFKPQSSGVEQVSIRQWECMLYVVFMVCGVSSHPIVFPETLMYNCTLKSTPLLR